MYVALLLRIVATGLPGKDFSGDLETRPGLVVVERGPYRWVRHPGDLAVGAYLIGLAGVFAYWPPVVVALGILAYFFRQRIATEEAINIQGIIGYREYMTRVRWRLSRALGDDASRVVNTDALKQSARPTFDP
jgi:protein-S-isoprenylcysteine O-methyltransferase Ste14